MHSEAGTGSQLSASRVPQTISYPVTTWPIRLSIEIGLKKRFFNYYDYKCGLFCFKSETGIKHLLLSELRSKVLH